MKKSISTFLKHPTKDNTNRSANPPVTRASTILFNSMQELSQHEKKIKANNNYINIGLKGEIYDFAINHEDFKEYIPKHEKYIKHKITFIIAKIFSVLILISPFSIKKKSNILNIIS